MPPRRRARAIATHPEALEVRTLLAAGDLDPSFGGDGVVDMVFNGQNTSSTQGNSAVLLANGQLLVAGEIAIQDQQRVALTRFNTDGSVDSSFGSEGTMLLPAGRLPRIALDSVGGTLVVYADLSTSQFRIQRLTASGTLDATYAGDGIAESPSPSFDFVLGISVGASDQLTVMTGEFVYRFRANGQPETAFGGTGRIFAKDANSPYSLTGFAIEPDGAVVVAAYQTVPSGVSGVALTLMLRLTRFGNDGVADTSFGTLGTADISISGDRFRLPGAPARLSDGTLVVPVLYETGIVVIGWKADGRQALSFGENGKAVLATVGSPGTPLIRPVAGGGAIVATSLFREGGTKKDWGFWRLRANGTLDTSFGDGGNRVVDLADRDDLRDVVVSGSGEVIGVGAAGGDFDRKQLLLSRVTTEGAADTGFDGDGKVVFVYQRFGPTVVYPGEVAAQRDGKIVTGGWTKEPEFVVVRHNVDGTLDTTFGSGGAVKVALPLSGNPDRVIVTDVTLDSRGRILVAGSNGDGTSARGYVLRLLPDGRRDDSFGVNGVARIDNLSYLRALVLQEDDRIVIGGTVDVFTPDRRSSPTLTRLNENGAVDRSFGSGGVASIDQTPTEPLLLARGADGKLVVATTTSVFYGRLTLIRFFANGSLDTSFANGGILSDVDSGGDFGLYSPHSISVDLDGRITVGANSGVVKVVRVLADGSRDTTFGSPSAPGHANFFGGGAIQRADGSYLSPTNGFNTPEESYSVSRYDTRGQSDSTWGTNGSLTVAVPIRSSRPWDSLIELPDGRVLIVGTRTPDGQPTSLRLIRLQAEPGIVTSALGTLTTTESGTTATFDIRLSSKPTADVTIPVTSSDTSEGTVSVNSLTFTPDNWSTAQTVTITGVDDSLFDADQRYRILLGPATSTDANYNGKTIAPVEVRNRDDETLRFFRSFNPQANFHFFTTSVSEFQGVQPNGYNDESSGRGGFSLAATQATGFTPLFRLYNLQKGFHYYTASAAERDALLALNPPQGDPNFGKVGWRFEGSPGFIADTQQPGTSQVFRLYNRTSGTHLFTENPAVKAAVLQLQGWEEHAPLGFAFLVDDAAPTTPAPPPTPVLLESSSVTSVTAGSPSGNPASLVATPSGSRSLPAAVSSALETLAEGPVEVVEDGPLDVDTLDTYLASLTGELVGTLLG